MSAFFAENLTPDVLMKLGAILALILMSAFFSGSETALTAASRSRMHARAKEGDKAASMVDKLLLSRERLIGALLLGNNLVNILASALMTGLMLSLFGDVGVFYATIIMTLLVLIFAEVMPKTYAITRPDEAAMSVASPVRIVVWVFAPMVSIVQILVNSVLRLFGVRADASPWSVADEIRGAVNLHSKEGRVNKRERDRILGVLNIGDLSVEDVMIHRKNLVMVDADLSAKSIVETVLDSGHSRVPVWREDQDNVIGVLHAKDLLRGLNDVGGDIGKLDIPTLMRAPWFMPETTSVLAQLRAFQQKHAHFALVVDEYGALMGVITLEDIIEEIVGDIKDEFDEVVQGVKPQKDGSVIVSGDVPVRDLNRARDWNLPDDEAVTIAGLIIHESQTIPEVGQIFAFHKHRFEILEKHKNQITAIKVRQSSDPVVPSAST